MKKTFIAVVITTLFICMGFTSVVSREETVQQQETTGSISFTFLVGAATGEAKVTCEMVYPNKEKVGEIDYSRGVQHENFENLEVPGIYRVYASSDETWLFGLPLHGMPRLVVLTKSSPYKNIMYLLIIPGLK